MEKNEIEEVARISTVQTVNSLRGELGNLVRAALPVVLAEAKQEKSPAPMFRRAYVDPPVKEVSGYGKATMESARWRAQKGPCLGSARMYKANDGVLMIDQYGLQCSVLHRSEHFIRSCVRHGEVVTAGTPPWDKFHVMDGELQHVIARLNSKGWKQVIDAAPKVQLELLPKGKMYQEVAHA